MAKPTHHPFIESGRHLFLIVAGLGIVVDLTGCGQTKPVETTAQAPEESGNPNEPTPLPTASIPNPLSTEPDVDVAVVEPEEGSPEWLIREIQRVRILPFPGIELTEEATDEGDEPKTEEAPKTEETAEAAKQRLATVRTLRRERNQQVVKLATEALALTHKDPAKEIVFLAAVHHLLDARFQLAMQGDQESIEGLYDAAQVFYDRTPDSPAASEAQLTLVNLAHQNARNFAKTEPKWLQEFARQAQVFATRFPAESARTLPQLVAAGRSCELHGLMEEARSCYMLIQSKFPESPQARQIAGILRRLELIGKEPELAGPTLDGNFINLSEFREPGKAVVVIFWATHAKPFTDQFKMLKDVTEKYKKYTQVISINLDSEETPVDQFLEQSGVTWPVIFHVEQDKRGWNAPVAAYYGVSSLPSIWIVDPNGKVAETSVTSESLEPRLREILLKHRDSKKAAAAESGPEN